MQKNKQRKLSKKRKKQLSKIFNKLGQTRLVNELEKSNSVNNFKLYSVKDILKDIPGYSIFRSSQGLTITNSITNQIVNSFLPNTDYVTTVSGYMDLINNIKKTGSINNISPSPISFRQRYKRYSGEDLTNKSVLICRQGGLGDIVATQMIIKYLKHLYPTCHIIYATSNTSKHIINNYWPKGLVNKVVEIPFEAQILDTTDYHIFFEGLIERAFDSKNYPVHALFLESMGFDNLDLTELSKNFKPELIINQQLVDNNLKNLISPNTIGIHPFASVITRTMSIDMILDLISVIAEIGYNIAIFCDPNNIEDVHIKNMVLSEVSKNYRIGSKIIDVSAYCNTIDNYLYLLSLLYGLITVDSSAAHFASALGIPTSVVSGSFSGESVYYLINNVVWENAYEHRHASKLCDKAACHYHASIIGKCPCLKQKKIPICMTSQMHNSVVIIERLLNLIETNKRDDIRIDYIKDYVITHTTTNKINGE